MLGASRFAAALSRHVDPAAATGEVVGQVLEATGPAPDLAVLFTSGHHRRAFDDVVAACSALLAPGALVGACADGVLAGAEEAEAGPALALWTGRVGPVAPLRLETLPGDPPLVAGLPTGIEPGSTVLVLADPTSFHVAGLVDRRADLAPGVAVVGGLVAASDGAARLAVDEQVHGDGAVGVVLPAGAGARAVVAQGCRPIGEPWVVTHAEGPLLLELAGRPALERVEAVLAGLDLTERRLATAGLHIGIAARERGVERYGPGDFVVRSVLGADRGRGAVAVGDVVEVGQVVQLQVRDPDAAHVELLRALADVDAGTGGGALVFNCTARGERLFRRPHHDASLVSEALGGPVAGASCDGELGPVGDRNALHTCSAAVLLLP